LEVISPGTTGLELLGPDLDGCWVESWKLRVAGKGSGQRVGLHCQARTREAARPTAMISDRAPQTAEHKGEQSLEAEAANGDSPLPLCPIKPRCKMLTQHRGFTKSRCRDHRKCYAFSCSQCTRQGTYLGAPKPPNPFPYFVQKPTSQTHPHVRLAQVLADIVPVSHPS